MYAFYVSLHARPVEAAPGDALDLAGHAVRPLVFAREALAATPMACSFEEVCARLETFERLFCEPDGSFVWTSSQAQPPWQLDGNLYDRQGQLLFVDLKGTCPRDALDRLLAALGWPETPLMFQLTREAVFLDEADFRRLAAAGAWSSG